MENFGINMNHSFDREVEDSAAFPGHADLVKAAPAAGIRYRPVAYIMQIYLARCRGRLADTRYLLAGNARNPATLILSTHGVGQIDENYFEKSG
jgi:hypothetical protein